MPTQTFYNLDKQKRQRLVACALAEFEKNALTDSSVANIVKAANISRGSFYQYFENLADCYSYILRLYEEKIARYIQAQHIQADYFSAAVYQFSQTYIQLCLDSPHSAFLRGFYFSAQPHLKHDFLYHILTHWLKQNPTHSLESWNDQLKIDYKQEGHKFLNCLVNMLTFAIVKGYQQKASSQAILSYFLTEFEWLLQGVSKNEKKEGV